MSGGNTRTGVAAAGTAFAAGDYERSRVLALEGLADDPDSAELLRIAGRSSVELGEEDATVHLDRLTSLTPDDPHAWVDLGLAHAAWGDMTAAADAFSRAVNLDLSSTTARLHRARALHAAGRTAEAIEVLEVVAQRADEDVQRTRLDLAWIAQRWLTALDAAQRLLETSPDDLLALLTLAEVQLELGDFTASSKSFARLRAIDRAEGHETYALHGQVEALLCGERWRAALDIAIDATRLDRHQLTTDLLSFCSNRLFGERSREAPSFDELRAALASERALHRRLHLEEALS